uniref:Uncharacterized protein n=1 Tax=Minutocellus polymorphus TaxID=265543 RepID=A0A7S0ACD7_9STRA|mmetsp:Transcript_10277/g.16991  ORF Transcript_10277/g.16991 Transcript_10277/m.16991 type:complete len:231 (+) Transcript_10277:138-830(+)
MSSARRFCSLPHGQGTLWTGILATFAFILSDAAMGTCRFVIRTPANEEQHGIGLFSWEKYDAATGDYLCYSANIATRGIDAGWTAARAFSGMAAAFGFVCMILVWCATCLVYPSRGWKMVALGFLFSSVSAICTLIYFSSWACEDGCIFSIGAGFALAASVLFAICAGVCWKMPPAKTEEEDPAFVTPGTVTTTETVRPDGSRVLERITINEDGSRSVERAVERPEDVIW